MMIRIIPTLTLLTALLWPFSVVSQVIYHPGPEFEQDSRYDYFVDLLRLALEESKQEFGHFELFQAQNTMQQKRQLLSLKHGRLSVAWTMTTAEREQHARPIRIPLMMGLLGYRLLVVNKQDQARFASLEGSQQLKPLLAYQGHDWPDLTILQSNGYNAKPFSWFLGLYKQLDLKKFDYYPRGILEAYREVDEVPFENLAVDSKHLLYYPTAIYFFVDQDNELLARRIEAGLMRMAKTGRLKQFLLNYGTHRADLKRANIPSRTIHRLDNPMLSEQTPLEDDRLWLSYDELVDAASK